MSPAVGGGHGLAVCIGGEQRAPRDGAAELGIGDTGAGDLDAAVLRHLGAAGNADVGIAGGGGLNDRAVGGAPLDDPVRLDRGAGLGRPPHGHMTHRSPPPLGPP